LTLSEHSIAQACCRPGLNLAAPWQICGIFSAKAWQPAFYTEPFAATHPPQKKLVLPQEKLRGLSLPSVCRKTRRCS
jgi:hypothetical protein